MMRPPRPQPMLFPALVACAGLLATGCAGPSAGQDTETQSGSSTDAGTDGTTTGTSSTGATAGSATTGAGTGASTATTGATTSDATTTGVATDSAGSTATTSAGATTTGSTTTDAGTTGSTGTPVILPPAVDVTVTRVSINQAVEIDLFRDGAWVGTNRNAPVIRNRVAAVRAYYQTNSAFQTRQITGRLTMAVGGEQVQALRTFELQPGKSSSEDALGTTFTWFVPGEYIQPDTTFQVELLEADATQTGGTTPVVAPPSPELIGVETEELMRIKAVLVPIDHKLAGQECAPAPELTPEQVEYFRRDLHQQNPTSVVEVSVREPALYTGAATSFSTVLSFIANLRDSDNADPAAYYYGLIIPCDGGDYMVGGQAIDIPKTATPTNAWSRVALGRFTSSIKQTSQTFVHEIGHTQGRRHVACNGEEGGPDWSYPYSGGKIDKAGVGIEDFGLRKSSSPDYMTYCAAAWISDWGYNLTWTRIKEIMTWDTLDGVTQPGLADDERLLIGLFDERGGEHWFTTPGRLEVGERASYGELRMTTAAGELPVAATRTDLGDGGYNVVAQLPPAHARLQGVTSLKLHAPNAAPHAIDLAPLKTLAAKK